MEVFQTYPSTTGAENLAELAGTSIVFYGCNDLAERLCNSSLPDYFFVKIIYGEDGRYWACISISSQFGTSSHDKINHSRMVEIVEAFCGVNPDLTALPPYERRWGVNMTIEKNFREGAIGTVTDSNKLSLTSLQDVELGQFLELNGFTVLGVNDNGVFLSF